MDIPLPGVGVEGSEDYSPETTVVTFDQPLPLLRAPVPSSSPGEPHVLAFRDAASWRAAWEAAEAGARAGCSITATRKCKVPWWKSLFGGVTIDYQEREQCEEREMASCLKSAKEACIKFSNEKCNAPFRDARIATEGLLENADFAVWGAEHNGAASASLCVANSQCSSNPGATNYKGSDLLDSLASQDNSNSG